MNLLTHINDCYVQFMTEVNKYNRQHRRKMRTIILAVGSMTAMAKSAYAAAPDDMKEQSVESPSWMEKIMDGISGWMEKHMTMKVEGSKLMVGKLAEGASRTILHTDNWLSFPELNHLWFVCWGIVNSFTGLLLAKHGWKMMTAKFFGGETPMRPTDLLLRLMAGGLLSLLTIPVIGMGIDMSNAIVKTMIKNTIESTDIFKDVLGASIGQIFWMLGFIISFGILYLKNHLRHLHMILLSCLSPVGTTMWSFGSTGWLATLAKEMTVVLATPIIQAILFCTGDAIMIKMAGANHEFFNHVNSSENLLLMEVATLWSMIFTPQFLRAFIHGSITPFKWVGNIVSAVAPGVGKAVGAVGKLAKGA